MFNFNVEQQLRFLLLVLAPTLASPPVHITLPPTLPPIHPWVEWAWVAWAWEWAVMAHPSTVAGVVHVKFILSIFTFPLIYPFSSSSY